MREYYLKVRVPKEGYTPRVVFIRTGLSHLDPLYHKTRHKMMREKALQMISGQDNPECENCGCDIFELLEINHKNGGGNKEAKERKGENLYALVLRGRRKVDDLNILCKVCNALHALGLTNREDIKNCLLRYEIRWK